MPIDPTKPLLPLTVGAEQPRHPARPDRHPRPAGFTADQQRVRLGPKFSRLRQVLDRGDSELVLRQDPDGLAPERLMVFEVEEAISDIAGALAKVPGLSLIDEDEIELEDDTKPHLYLLVPDFAALRNIESLWRRWVDGRPLPEGYTPWRNLFRLLRDVRPWGPQDRLGEFSRSVLAEEIDGREDDDSIVLEVELVFREGDDLGQLLENDLRSRIAARGGTVITRSRIPEIQYHALLVRLSVAEVQAMIELTQDSVVGHEAVMYVCPQSAATAIDLSDETEGRPRPDQPENDPILAVIDGYPVAGHRDLAGRLVIDDLFGLEAESQLVDRIHGTAMTSLITRGDLNIDQPALPRTVHVVPVLGRHEEFPPDRLIVDMIYNAVQSMVSGTDPTAPNVLIVNLSLGNRRSLFDRRISAWGRLLDRLAYQYGLLFVVSAGNHHLDHFDVPNFANWNAFEDAPHAERAIGTLEGIRQRLGFRRLLAPSESVNALTIGAANLDSVADLDRRGKLGVSPYIGISMANPSSALGPGFGNSVKPDILFPGGCEHLYMVRSGGGLTVGVSSPSRAHGLKVAAPPTGANESPAKYSGNTSGAAALASRTAHQVHDALEAAYGDDFLDLPKASRAVLLKALLVHTASWPHQTAELIRSVLGPADGRQHVRQKDNIRRLIGYGFADPERAISCVEDRATFWAIGALHAERGVQVDVPIPACIGAKARPHRVTATLAWLTPVAAGRKAYRNVRLFLEEPIGLDALGIAGASQQPDQNQGRRGTVYSRTWEGERAAVLAQNHTLPFWVQRQPDLTDANVNVAVPFGLAVTVEMPGETDLYAQVFARVRAAAQVRT